MNIGLVPRRRHNDPRDDTASRGRIRLVRRRTSRRGRNQETETLTMTSSLAFLFACLLTGALASTGSASAQPAQQDSSERTHLPRQDARSTNGKPSTTSVTTARDATSTSAHPSTVPPTEAPDATASTNGASNAPTSAGTEDSSLEPRRFAVIVGNNRSLNGRRPDLHFADDDAARYFEILTTLAPGRSYLLTRFDRDTSRLFSSARSQTRSPTRLELERLGAKLRQQVKAAQREGRDTELYFVFAGHGDVAQGEGFIELADGRFRSRDLEAWLSQIPFTRAHVILDSCNSFFMLGVRKPGGRHFATSEDAARALSSRLPNVGVFLSTSAEGETFEWSEIQSGIFSHVVRSGLLGAADANADGAVSYMELAAFVDTATRDVRNPNMRPHVFARGPGAEPETPIVQLRSMEQVRRFALHERDPLRLRVRDADGLLLLDAHIEGDNPLTVALPDGWAESAVIERMGAQSGGAWAGNEVYPIPNHAEPVTLASLEHMRPRSTARGPAEAFRALFATPYGPRALSAYVKTRKRSPPPVFGISRQDTLRMQLVLDQIARVERSQRVTGSMATVGVGGLMAVAGVHTLDHDPGLSSGDKTEARIFGGILLGTGSLLSLAGFAALWAQTKGEKVAGEFRRTVSARGDTARAFAVADQRLSELTRRRELGRWTLGILGGGFALASATILTLNEVDPPSDDKRKVRRLLWGGGVVAGASMLASALVATTPRDILTTIWRDDPSLNQYQPSIAVGPDGAYLSLAGAF